MINEVIHGDCFEVMQQIPDGSIDMILCDLPYGTTQNAWDTILPLDKLWDHYMRVIKDKGAILLTATQPFASQLIISNPKMFRYDLIWHKSHAVGFLNARKMPLRAHEHILVFYKKMPVYNPQLIDKPPDKIRPINGKNRLTSNYGKFELGDHRTIPIDKSYPISVIKAVNRADRITKHSTQKPVALFEYLIKTYTNPDALVLDNCIGSGTTAIAALNCNRNFIGIEKELEFVAIARERMQAIQPKMQF